MLGEKADELRQLRQLLDIGDVAEVAGQDGGQIGPGPILPPPLGLAGDRLGKAAAQLERSSPRIAPRSPELAVEERSRKDGSMPAISARARSSIGSFPFAQTVRDAGRVERWRAGEQETARSVLVDRLLDRRNSRFGARWSRR
jgi:hypothetical protein